MASQQNLAERGHGGRAAGAELARRLGPARPRRPARADRAAPPRRLEGHRAHRRAARAARSPPRRSCSAPGPPAAGRSQRPVRPRRPTTSSRCCATRSASSRSRSSAPPPRTPTPRAPTPDRAARPGERARADDGRRARGARRRRRAALGGHLGADERGARAGRHGDRGRVPRARRRLDRAQPVGRRRPAGDLPARVRRRERARRGARDARAAAAVRPVRAADARAPRRTAATCSMASSRSSRAPATASCSSSPPSWRARGPALFIVESKTAGLSVEPEPAMGVRAAATGTPDPRGRASCPPARCSATATPRSTPSASSWRASGGARVAVGTGQAVLDYVIPLRQRAPGVRRADLEPPGGRVHGREHRDRARRHAPGDLPRGQPRRPGPRRSPARWRSRGGCAPSAGMAIGSDGVQLLGGHGYVKEHPVERWYRDLRAAGADGGSAARLMRGTRDQPRDPQEVRAARRPGPHGRDRDLPHELAQVRPRRARVPEGARHARRRDRRHRTRAARAAPAPVGVGLRRQRRSPPSARTATATAPTWPACSG